MEIEREIDLGKLTARYCPPLNPICTFCEKRPALWRWGEDVIRAEMWPTLRKHSPDPHDKIAVPKVDLCADCIRTLSKILVVGK